MSVMLSASRYRRMVLLCTVFPLAAQAHGPAVAEGLSGVLHLAASWRSAHQQSSADIESQKLWQIPGLLMGGHSTPYENNTSLDELSLWLNYRTPEHSYAVVKAGSHDGNELTLESAYIGQQSALGSWPAQLEAGRMIAFFSPGNHMHPATERFSLPALGYSALLGTHVQDTGVRVSVGDTQHGLSAGAEAYKGSAFPAAGNDGLYTGFLRYAAHWQALTWNIQAWHLTAAANNRRDDRSASGHSHGASTGSGFTGTFNGDSEFSGLYIDAGWAFSAAARAAIRAEWIQGNSTGTVFNEAKTQQIHLDGDVQSLYLEPHLQLARHTLALRYERLSISNHLSGAAVNTLGADAGLMNHGHNPQRISVAWNWQYSPALSTRLEWMNDRVAENHQPDVVTMGLIWKHRIF